MRNAMIASRLKSWFGSLAPTTRPPTADRTAIRSPGCIYRNRGISALEKSINLGASSIPYLDLTGIQAAIEEGLGVTVLAKVQSPTIYR